jgi:glycosyltransferase involved in cell wall biosynthesis
MAEPLVILHSESSTGWGGQEIRVFSELRWLKRRGHEVGLLAPHGSPLGRRAEAEGIPVTWIGMPWSLDPRAVVRIRGCLRRHRARLLVTHSSVDAWTAGLAARLAGVPVVRMRHLSVPVPTNPLSRAVYTALCDRIVTTGEAIRAVLVQRLRVPPTKVVSIPTGVDLERFNPDQAGDGRLGRELRLDPRAPLVGMIAVLRSWKGHLVFLQALRRVRDRRPDTQAILAGEGPYRPVIQDAIHAHGLEAHVRLLGHREDVAEILARLNVVVSASTSAEGVPQALLQALAMRRPVVASDVGGVPEIIRPGETGWLVPSGDPTALAEAILEALKNPAQARHAGERGRKLVEKEFSLDAMGERVERLYREVVAHRHNAFGGSSVRQFDRS